MKLNRVIFTKSTSGKSASSSKLLSRKTPTLSVMDSVAIPSQTGSTNVQIPAPATIPTPAPIPTPNPALNPVISPPPTSTIDPAPTETITSTSTAVATSVDGSKLPVATTTSNSTSGVSITPVTPFHPVDDDTTHDRKETTERAYSDPPDDSSSKTTAMDAFKSSNTANDTLSKTMDQSNAATVGMAKSRGIIYATSDLPAKCGNYVGIEGEKCKVREMECTDIDELVTGTRCNDVEVKKAGVNDEITETIRNFEGNPSEVHSQVDKARNVNETTAQLQGNTDYKINSLVHGIKLCDTSHEITCECHMSHYLTQ